MSIILIYIYNSCINRKSVNILESYVKKIDLLMMDDKKEDAIRILENAKLHIDKMDNNKLTIPGYYSDRVKEYIAIFD